MDVKADRLAPIGSASGSGDLPELLSQALAREHVATAREERLSRANALLRSCAERLGDVKDIDGFLGQVLLAMTELVGAHSSTVWTNDHEAGHALLRYVVEGGKAIAATLSQHPNAHSPAPFSARSARVVPGLGTAAAQPYQQSVADHPALYEDQRSYLQALGVVSMVGVPMILAGRDIGFFTLRLTDDRPLLDEERELVMALANQAAVALQLTRLAEQAKQAAVAVEREAAAKARADKMAQANALLRDCAERLGEIEDIDEFLGQVLLAMTEVLGAHSSTVWTYDIAARTSRLRYVVEGGRAVPARLSDHPNAGAPVQLPTNASAVMPGHGTARAQPHQRRVAENPGLYEEQRRYLLGLGILSMITVPMVLARQHIGDFTLRLTDDRPLLDDERELIVALANQAAVALHLTHLAQQAKQAAIAVEREEAAKARAEKLAAANCWRRPKTEPLLRVVPTQN